MGKKHSSCLTRILIFIFGLILLVGIIYFAVDSYIYLPGQKINHPQISDVRGIDVSKYQRWINWRKLKSAKIDDDNISFVVIKATEGATLRDKYFKRNFRNARKQGFIRGAYHFWSYSKSPEVQAKNYINNVTLKKGDLPPILDTETFPKNYNVDKFNKNVLKWLDIIEKHYGVTPIIYTNRNFKRRYLNADVFDRYPLWIANYNVKKPIYVGRWIMWQYSKAGRVYGIRHDVDLNVFNGTYEELQALTIK